MTQFTPLSEPTYDAQQADAERHDTEHDELGPKLMDKLLVAGWHVQVASYTRMRCPASQPHCEARVVLVNKAAGRKLFGFGADFEEAFNSAAGQV